MNKGITSAPQDPLGALVGWNAVGVLLLIILVEFALLQAFAVGVTTGIYRLVPIMAVGNPQGFDDWMSLFRVVSPTLTLPGGAAIVLSTWLLARRAQRAEELAAEQAKRAADAEAREAELRAQLAELRERPGDNG